MNELDKCISVFSKDCEEPYELLKVSKNDLSMFDHYELLMQKVLKKGNIILDKDIKVYLDDELVSEELDINILEKIIKKDVNKISDATILYSEIIENKKIVIRSDFSNLDLSNGKILVLPISVINSVKMLKKDVSFLRIYEFEKVMVLEYGVQDKEHFKIFMSGIQMN